MGVISLTRESKDRYGNLRVEFEKAIKSVYPELEVKKDAPGCWGHSGEIRLRGNTLTIPDGQYESNKHFHTAGHGIMAVETAHKKLNSRPLFLVMGYGYNGDYKSLRKCYYLFGQNEDGSFFLHSVRPRAGETGDLDRVREWIWSLKQGEVVAARQGDLAFIPKTRPSGKPASTWVSVGRHTIKADEIRQTKNRVYALNPVATHAEHNRVELEGWYEIRGAKAWRGSAD